MAIFSGKHELPSLIVTFLMPSQQCVYVYCTLTVWKQLNTIAVWLIAAERAPWLFLCRSDVLCRLCLFTSMHFRALLPDLCTWPSVHGRPRSLHHSCVCVAVVTSWTLKIDLLEIGVIVVIILGLHTINVTVHSWKILTIYINYFLAIKIVSHNIKKLVVLHVMSQ